MHIPYQQIASQLNLKQDDILLVSSDISKFSFNEMTHGEKFDLSLFIDSFKDVLTNGTLLFPSFTDYLKSGDTFDILDTAPTTGTLSSVAYKRNDFKRTRDPLHSFMVWGKQATELSAINNRSTFGHDSVFGFLHRNKALMLMVDIDLQHSFTFVHYVEEQKKVNYRKFNKLNINFIDEQKLSTKKEIEVYTKKLGISNSLNLLQQKFIDNGAMTVQNINGSKFMLLKLDEAYTIIEVEINGNKGKSLYRFSLWQFLKSFIKQLIT